jgi:hypothetical protein
MRYHFDLDGKEIPYDRIIIDDFNINFGRIKTPFYTSYKTEQDGVLYYL